MMIDRISRAELRVLLPAARACVSELERVVSESAEGCKRCFMFDHARSFCDTHKAIVPDEFKAAGCDDWRLDPVPF